MYYHFLCLKKEELENKINSQDFEYEDVLGDIIISIDRVKENKLRNMDIVLKENLHI